MVEPLVLEPPVLTEDDVFVVCAPVVLPCVVGPGVGAVTTLGFCVVGTVGIVGPAVGEAVC